MPRLLELVRRACLGLSALLGFTLPCSALASLDAPVSPHARPGVAALLRVLDRISGRSILSGQQELGWDPLRLEEDFTYIQQQTGKNPVVRGFDFGDYTQRPDDTGQLHATERAISWARRGGVVTFSCHLAVLIGSPGTWPQFYSKASKSEGTTFDIRQAVLDGTPENRELLAKLDLVAGELKKLQEAGVTVIWRPFHECSGGWFWWGVHGPEPFKQLWRLTFDRFTARHGLTNLIWCYNPTDAADKMAAWYPGDDVVDMVSLDVYPKTWSFFGLIEGRHPTFADEYRQMRAFTGGRKVVAMSENGAIPDPDQLFAEGAGWAYFMTWNQFENNSTHNSAAFLRKVYHHPKVITLDEFPALYRDNAAP